MGKVPYRSATVVGWSILIIVSPPAGTMIARLTSFDPIGANVVQVTLAAAVLVAGFVIPALRPLRIFIAVALMWAVGYLIVSGFYSTSTWQHYRRQAPTYEWVMADSLVQAIPMLLMLGVALLTGLTRRQLYLARGDLKARSSLGLFRFRRWDRLIAPIAIGFATVSLAFLVFRFGDHAGLPPRTLTVVSVVVLFPILNAINEEIRFRNVFLAAGLPLFGTTGVLLMTSVFFGLAHFGSFLGTSGAGGTLFSGLVYATGAALIGWILARATLDTGGVVAAWIIHAASDLILILGYTLSG